MVNDTIKQYLNDNVIKYSYVAGKANIPMNRFSYIMRGRRNIKAEEYLIICDILGVSANDLRNYNRVSPDMETV